MATPGFTAEYGLYRSTAHYSTVGYADGTPGFEEFGVLIPSAGGCGISGIPCSSDEVCFDGKCVRGSCVDACWAQVSARNQEYRRCEGLCSANPHIPCRCVKPGVVDCNAWLNCGGTCTDTGSDDNNCGMCGATCGANSSCQGSKCTCDTGYTDCSGVCCGAGSQCMNNCDANGSCFKNADGTIQQACMCNTAGCTCGTAPSSVGMVCTSCKDVPAAPCPAGSVKCCSCQSGGSGLPCIFPCDDPPACGPPVSGNYADVACMTNADVQIYLQKHPGSTLTCA